MYSVCSFFNDVSVRPSICPSVCLSVYVCLCLSVCLSVRPSICPCLSVCLTVLATCSVKCTLSLFSSHPLSLFSHSIPASPPPSLPPSNSLTPTSPVLSLPSFLNPQLSLLPLSLPPPFSLYLSLHLSLPSLPPSLPHSISLPPHIVAAAPVAAAAKLVQSTPSRAYLSLVLLVLNQRGSREAHSNH